MAIYKCKMCGANIEITGNTSVFECEYCGTSQTIVPESHGTGGNAENLLKRGNLALEDRKWDEAKVFFDRVLDINAEEPRAYIGKLLANTGYLSLDELWQEGLWNKVMAIGDYKKAYRFSDENFKRTLDEYNNRYIYKTAAEKFQSEYIPEIEEALGLFMQIIDYKDSVELIEKCRDKIYSHALLLMNNANSEEKYLAAKSEFEFISGYSDSDYKAEECASKAELARKEAIYSYALKYEDSDDIRNLSFAAKQFGSIPDYKDSKEKAELLKARIRRIENDAKEARRQAELRNQEFMRQETAKQLQEEERRRKIKIIVTAAIVLIAAIFFVVSHFVIPDRGTDETTAASESVNEYIDSEDITDNSSAELGEKISYLASVRESLPKDAISAGIFDTVVLKSDGTVFATGYGIDDQCSVFDWTDITAVSSGSACIAGLKSNGTVVTYFTVDPLLNYDVSYWTDIVSISAGGTHIAGLKSDGTAIKTGSSRDVRDWTDIVAVSAGSFDTIGLKSDGTVVATGNNYNNSHDVSDWTDIVAIASNDHTVGLKSDGTVVATGYNYYGQCDLSDWTDIVAISVGDFTTVGLKSDGTVVAAGRDWEGQCDVSDWTDIVAVSAGGYHTVGLKSDGTLVTTGANNEGQCNVQDWSDIKTTND